MQTSSLKDVESSLRKGLGAGRRGTAWIGASSVMAWHGMCAACRRIPRDGVIGAGRVAACLDGVVLEASNLSLKL
jgi:hypothetical protein